MTQISQLAHSSDPSCRACLRNSHTESHAEVRNVFGSTGATNTTRELPRTQSPDTSSTLSAPWGTLTYCLYKWVHQPGLDQATIQTSDHLVASCTFQEELHLSILGPQPEPFDLRSSNPVLHRLCDSSLFQSQFQTNLDRPRQTFISCRSRAKPRTKPSN